MSAGSRRAFHPEGARAGNRIVLSPEESRHLCRVLRLPPGSPISVFDGAGSEWDAVLESASPKGAEVVLGPRRENVVEPPLRVTLVQSLVRPDRLEFVLQKGTEVGLAGIRLVRTARSEVPDPSPARIERWRKILVEATKQCGRRRVPELGIEETVPPLPESGERAILLDPEAERPLADLLGGAAPPRLALAVGPEGGFEEGESARWSDAGWETAHLGPRTLRTETAGAIAAALALYAYGDLGRRCEPR